MAVSLAYSAWCRALSCWAVRRHGGPWLDVDLTRATAVDDEDLRAGGQGRRGISEVVVRDAIHHGRAARADGATAVHLEVGPEPLYLPRLPAGDHRGPLRAARTMTA